MPTTDSYQNVSGTSSNVAFFFFGQTPNPLINVVPGWIAHGANIVNAVVQEINNSTDINGNKSSVITIKPSLSFLSGSFYNFSYDPPICFLENTKILTDKGYIPIQELKNGDLVKSLQHGYKAITMIGKKEIYHSADKKRLHLFTFQTPIIYKPIL